MTPPLGFLLFACILLADSGLAQQRRSTKSSSVSSSTSASQVVDFDCPEEFGYYPHPADCTQYYVCVFGGALLESCTGGLMYSHELQTCDWPRNVGCGGADLVSTVSSIKAQQEQRVRQPTQLRSQQQPPPQQHQQQQQQQHHHQQQQQQQVQRQQYSPQRPLQRDEAIPKHHLYTEEELGPAEEVESDRQQRVYRGQPATLGQVARDRDGLSRHSNALQVAPNGREKLSVISFGTQQQYNFPGDPRTLHPRITESVTTWTAASPHFSPPHRPPPQHLPAPPLWPPLTQHYNRPSHGSRFFPAPNLQVASSNQYSRPIRFPKHENQDEFVPIVGQGVKLPKPAPELLITPGYNDQTEQIIPPPSLRPPTIPYRFKAPENEPENYSYYNLGISPILDIKPDNVKTGHFITSNKSHPALINHSDYKNEITSGIIQDSQKPLNNPTSYVKNNTSQGYEILHYNLNTTHPYRANYGIQGKPKPNFVVPSNYSGDYQLSSPNKKGRKNEVKHESAEDYSKPKYSHSSSNSNENNQFYSTEDGSLSYNKNPSYKNSSYEIHPSERIPQQSSAEGSYDNSQDKGTYHHPDEEGFSQGRLKQNLNTDASSYSTPSKELTEYSGSADSNPRDPFSDPEFDFDKYFHELSELTSEQQKGSSHKSRPWGQINEHNLSPSSEGSRPKKLKPQNPKYLTTISPIYKNRTPNNFEIDELSSTFPLGNSKKERVLNSSNPVSTNGNQQRSKTKKINKFPINFSEDESQAQDESTVETTFKKPTSQEESSFGHFSDEFSSENPIRYKNTLSPDPTPFSFNFSLGFPSFEEFYKGFGKVNLSSNKDSQYDRSDEEPSLHSVHRQNSLSEKKKPPKDDDEETYDDDDEEEEYYDSNEDYYSDEYSIENLKNYPNQKVIPPSVPNKLKNIDSIKFKNDDDYDEASVEEEDEPDYLNPNKQSLHNDDETINCSKKYKNHKCNIRYEKHHNEGNAEGSDKHYQAQEDTTLRPGHYEVTEDIAETQQLLIKSNKNQISKPSFPNLNFTSKQSNGYTKLSQITNNSTFTPPVENTTVLNFTHVNNNYFTFANSSQTPKSFSQTNQNTHLTSLTADQGMSHFPLNFIRNFTRQNPFNTHFLSTDSEVRPQNNLTTLNSITMKRPTGKIYNSRVSNKIKPSFSSETPKPPRHMRQRTMTKPTNLTGTNLAGGESIEQPMTQLKFNSKQTNARKLRGRQQSISPPQYIEQTTTRVTGRGYNTTQQQQYTPSPYDPYYSIYEDDGDLYKDIDYSQYTGQQQQQPPPQYQTQAAQPKPQPVQQVQPVVSRKPPVQYSPPPPPPAYNTVQQDVYSPTGNQDYNDNYNLQDEDIDYKQSDIDLKGNRSRQKKHQVAPFTPNEAGKDGRKQNINRRLTLTAAFSFDNDKSPVASSKTLAENSRKQPSRNSFQVEDTPNNSKSADTHELVLSYLKEDNPISRFGEPRQTKNIWTAEENPPKLLSVDSFDLDTSEISSTSSPKVGSENNIRQIPTSRPFRIIVPSTTANPIEEVTIKSAALPQRFERKETESLSSGSSDHDNVRPYKLPPLTRETIATLAKTLPQSSQITSPRPFTKVNSKAEPPSSSSLIRNQERQTSSRNHPSSFSEDSRVNSRKVILITSDINSTVPSSQLPQDDKKNFSLLSNEQNSNIESLPDFGDSLESHLKGRRVPSYDLRSLTSTEDSIFKFIPIQAVKKETQNENLPSGESSYARKSNGFSGRRQNSGYQVSEESEEFVSSTPSNLFLSNPHSDYFNRQPPAKENVSNERPKTKQTETPVTITQRPLYQFSRTTEQAFQKPLYSLQIKENNGSFVGGSLVLATLETITNPPSLNNKKPTTNVARSSSSPAVAREEYNTDRHHSTRGDIKTQIVIKNPNDFNNQAQTRLRSRDPEVKNKYSEERDNSVFPTSGTKPERSTEKPATFLPRSRYSPFQRKVQTTTEQATSTYSSQPLENIEKYATEKIISTTESVKDAEQTAIQTQPDIVQPRTAGESITVNNYNNKQRSVVKPSNRENNKSIFDFDEDVAFYPENRTPTKNSFETDITLQDPVFKEDQFNLRRRQTLPTRETATSAETTEEPQTESTFRIKPNRLQSIRKMQIRKKLVTTSESPLTLTPSLDENYDTSVNNYTYTKHINEDTSSRTNKQTYFDGIAEEDEDFDNSRSNSIPVTPGLNQDDFSAKRLRDSAGHRNNQFRKNHLNYHENYDSRNEGTERNTIPRSNTPTSNIDPYQLLRSSTFSKVTDNRKFEPVLSRVKPINTQTSRNESRPNHIPQPQSYSPIAAEINSFFKDYPQSSTTTTPDSTSTFPTTTQLPMTTVERIRDKFRLGSFPKPAPLSDKFAKKPSLEESTPPALPSDRCSQELDNESECNEKPLLRVRPTSASPESQSTPGLTRGSTRNRGSATYTVSPNEAEPPQQRGTPSSHRNRPTLKPSTSIVSKASEFIDIYRYPPSRPEPIYPTPQVDKTAAKCRKDVCLLPDCSCGGKEIPGDLLPEETPQIVLLTFDDSVNDLNKGLYSDLFEKGRTNPNGCPISATFYVSHEWTDYSQVQNLYSSGHEIASHSVSHSFGEQFSVKKWTREIAGQREILAAYGGVKQEDIRGMRAPFLAIGGNKMFKMLYDSNFTYDSSMPVYENKPPSWPYTLDYKVFHDCMIPPCPTRSYPGVWEVPMVMWQDLNGGRCSMGDACSNPPAADGVYKMLIKNFERHFTSNRSPFGLFYHAAWFTQPHHKEGFIAFLDTINKMPEVWIVTNWQAIQWVRDPTPMSRLNNFAPFQCNYPERPRRCNNPKVCNLWHKSGVRYMRTCQPCPDVYPWTGKTGVRNSRVDNQVITE